MFFPVITKSYCVNLYSILLFFVIMCTCFVQCEGKNLMSRAQSAAGRISVIVTTYNSPEALRSVLYGLSNQTDGNFEVIVADDGSDERTAEVIKTSRIRPVHVWHEHRGFRAAAIRNQAIRAAKGEYCIFL